MQDAYGQIYLTRQIFRLIVQKSDLCPAVCEGTTPEEQSSWNPDADLDYDGDGIMCMLDVRAILKHLGD